MDKSEDLSFDFLFSQHSVCEMILISWMFYLLDYMAHLVEVQHERGATGGHTFHSLLSTSLPQCRGQDLMPYTKGSVSTD